MAASDPRWHKFWQNLAWFGATVVVLFLVMRYYRSPVALAALWGVGLLWGGWLAYRLSQMLFGDDQSVASEAWAEDAMAQAEDYLDKISLALDSETATGHRSSALEDQVEALVDAIESLALRVSYLRQDDVIRKDVKAVPEAIEALEARLAAASDAGTRRQLERTLANRRTQLESLTTLQTTIERAEIQVESTLSQLGTIYSQLLTGQSTSHVADYSRLESDIGEEVQRLEDQLEALREVKLAE